MCARKLGASVVPEPEPPPSPEPSGKGVQIDFEPDEEDQQGAVPSPPATEPSVETSSPLSSSDETRVRQLTRLALLSLKAVNEHLLPAAAKENIAIDAATAHAWALSLFLAASRYQDQT